MPSSYTPSLRLVLPVTGELSGTWGDTVNQGLTELVEEAIAGTAVVVMSDANYTLTTNTEASDEARQAVIDLTGALTATRDVICPAVSKLYVVRNNTTGAQDIVFKTATGTGVTVAPGTAVLLYCDGVNVSNAVTVLNGNVTGNVSGTAANVTGTVAIANGGTGAVTAKAASSALGTLAANTQSKTGAYTVIASDYGAVLWCSNTFTLGLTAAATLGAGFNCGVINVGTGIITIDPNASEQIDGAATKTLSAGESAVLTTDGSTWRTVGYSSASVPVGTVIAYAGTSAPSGWLALPTTATNVSRTTYASLFAAIGTTWGAGDGSTTFGLPYIPANQTAVQASGNVGTSTTGQVIAHVHSVPVALNSTIGAFGNALSASQAADFFGANGGSTGGSANLPAGTRWLWCIKI